MKAFKWTMFLLTFVAIGAPACVAGQAGTKEYAQQRGDEIVRQLLVTLRGDGTIRVTDLEGNAGQPCALCSLAYRRAHPEDPNCERLQEALKKGYAEQKIPRIEVCLEQARVESVVPLALMEATENPSCVYYRSIGTEFDFTEEEIQAWLDSETNLSGVEISFIMKHCFN